MEGGTSVLDQSMADNCARSVQCTYKTKRQKNKQTQNLAGKQTRETNKQIQTVKMQGPSKCNKQA